MSRKKDSLGSIIGNFLRSPDSPRLETGRMSVVKALTIDRDEVPKMDSGKGKSKP